MRKSPLLDNHSMVNVMKSKGEFALGKHVRAMNTPLNPTFI